jgi:murein DD-endopeptidase MepM/ murein hydrolase activator NlpD
MKIAITEDQVIRLKRKLNKQVVNEDFLDDLIKKGGEYVNKGVDAAKDFISGLDIPIEKKSVDEPGKADFVSSDVDKFFEILDTIDEKIVQQKYGQMSRQQKVEAIQIGLQLLGYELKRFGTDGLFGPETAAAVNKFKTDKNIQDDDTSFDLHEATLIAPIPINNNIKHGFNEKRGNRIHGGIDIPAKVGTQIKSIADGKVIAAGALDSRCGDGVSIDHADGLRSSYCHLSGINVSNGDTIKQGAIIGLTGGAVGAAGSGNSKGPHLHLTLKKDGQRVDPMQYFGSSIGTYYDDGKSSTMVGGATITPEMVKELSAELKAENITKEDLEKYVDKAVTTGGSAEFTDLDLNDSSDVEAYEKICDNFIKQRDPGARVTGAMMADSAVKSFKTYGKYVPPELALAQLTLEGGIGSAKDSRPNKTNNPFNVGNTETSSKQFPTVAAGVETYYNLIARKYLVRGKTAADLVNDFKNDQGNNYATADTYEAGLKNLILSIRKRNENVYTSLAQRKSENLAESLLLEADKRQAIKNAFGLNDLWAEEFHRMSDKLSVWIASTYIDAVVADRTRNHNIPDGEDLRTYVINNMNSIGPGGDDGWNINYKPNYEYILHWIRAPRREQLNIRDLTFDAAYQMAEEWHESLQIKKQTDYQETGDVFIDYRNADGVGYYWVHLNKSYCSDEADRMGHCARSNTGQLISFRRINDFGEGESYLTVDYRPGGVLGDFHRHGNKKPTTRFHRQIVDFLLNTRYPVSSLTKNGVHRYEENFHLSDLSPADLKRVYAGNSSLRFDINNENTWPEIIDAIISNEVNFEQYPDGVKLKLLKKSKSLNKEDEILTKFTDEVVTTIFNEVGQLDNTDKTTFIAFFGNKLNDLLKRDFDKFYDSSSSSESKLVFIEFLRTISQHLFNVYQSFCDYIDYGFKKFSEETRVEIVSSRGIKRSLFTCTDTIPFISRYVDNTPVDMNGNISVKTEEGLWGLVKQNGETILHPQFLAVAPNPIDRFKTYIVKNQNGDFYKLNIADMSYTRLEKKR